jgi:hypothetical protein
MAAPQIPPSPPLPPNKTSPIVWILVGVLCLMFLTASLVGVGAWFLAHKVRQAARNPQSIVKTMLAMNPNVDVLSTDEGSGKITLKDRQTGKVVTMDFDQVKNGRISFQEDGKEAVVIQGDGQHGSVEVKSADGTAHIGAGSLRTPAWVPVYAGSSPEGTYSVQNANEDSGHYLFKTKDSAAKVSQYYEDTLKTAGFTVSTLGESDTRIISAKTDSDKRTIVVTLGTDDGQTTVSVLFNEKKP